MNRDTLAVMDVGSNSIRCMIAKVRNQEIEVLATDLSTTCLGKGLSYSSNIQSDSIEKTIKVLKNYHEMVKYYNARLCKVIGTSALREANNTDVLLKKAKEEIGIQIDVVSGVKEAFLSANGALYDKESFDQYLVFDLGGGSLELISKSPDFVKSLDIGAVKMLEKVKGTDDFIDLKELYKIVSSVLREKNEDLKIVTADKVFLVGLGGTATSFPMIDQELEVYDGNKIQDYYMSKRSILETTVKLNNLSLTERKKIKGMPEEREGIIVPGGGIIWSLLNILGYEGYYASDKDLMYGMLYEEIINEDENEEI